MSSSFTSAGGEPKRKRLRKGAKNEAKNDNWRPSDEQHRMFDHNFVCSPFKFDLRSGHLKIGGKKLVDVKIDPGQAAKGLKARTKKGQRSVFMNTENNAWVIQKLESPGRGIIFNIASAGCAECKQAERWTLTLEKNKAKHSRKENKCLTRLRAEYAALCCCGGLKVLNSSAFFVYTAAAGDVKPASATDFSIRNASSSIVIQHFQSVPALAQAGSRDPASISPFVTKINTNVPLSSDGERFVGRSIIKHFVGHGDFTGKVTAYLPSDNLWHVEYEDGDAEDMDVEDMLMAGVDVIEELVRAEMESAEAKEAGEAAGD